MGTCSRLARYLETWARLTDVMKQKTIAFFSDPTDTSITYQDVDKMPIQAFAAINKTLWRGILMNAPDRLKLSIQMKIMMSNDCEVHSMLKGLNFTDLYKISESKGEVDSTIFQEGFCKAILRNCSKLTPDMWMFLNASAYSCLPYVPQDCAQPQDMFSSLRNSTDFSRPPMSTDGMSRSSPLPMFSGSPTFPPRSSDVISRSSPLPMISGSTPFRTMSSDGIPRSSPLPMISGSTPFRTMSSDGMLSRTGPMLTSPQRPLPSDSPSPTGLMMTSSPMPSGSLPPPREIVGSNTGEIPPADYSVVMYSGCDAGAEGLRCPSNCSDCYQGKLATDCYSYDKYGNFLGCRTFAGNATLMRALNDTTVAKVFNATAEIGTCSRLKKYLRKWISLDSATRDKSIQFLKDPKSVSDEDVVDKIPVEVFAVANRTLLDNVTQQASIKQKLYLATTSYLSRSCEIQDHLKSFDLEQSYKDALQAGNVDASYFNTSLCKAYMAGKCDISMSKWRFALDNAQECVLDKAVCLKDVKDATLDSLFTTDVEATAQDLFRRRMNSYLGNKTTFACDADFLQVMKVCSLDPKFVIKFCDQSKIPMFSPSEEHADEWNILKAEALQSANTDFSSLDKATLVSYLPISKSLMKTLDKSTLDKVKEAVCTDDVLAGVTFSEDDIRDVLDVLLTKGVLNKTTDKACLVKYAPMEVADLMDATDLRNNYDNGNLNVTKLTQTQSKEIWEMVKTELTSDTKIKENAELIIRHGPSTLDSLGIPLTKDTAKTILNAVKNTDNINPAVKTSAMMASYDDSDPAESLKMIMSASSEEMLSFFPIKKIMSIAPASLTALCGSALTADIPKKLGKALMNKCQDAGTQLDLSTVTNLLPIIGSAPKERFDAIDTNSADCASILSKIAESTSITAEKYEYVCQKLHTCVSSSNLDLSDASTLSGNALACFNKTMLKTLGGSCSDITTKICSADFSIMDGKSRKTDIKEYALECLSVSSTLTESSIDSLGNCVELLGSTEISKMDKSATKAVIKALSGSGDRFTCWTMAEKFMARYSAVKGSDIISVTDIMGTFNDWTVGLQTADFSSLSGLCDTISAIGKSFKKRGALKRKLKKAGLLTECSEDYDAIRTEIKASITCAQLTSMGTSMLSSLTTSQLSGIQDTDFTQCASLLGSPTDYSTEQKQALATVAKRATVYGAPSTWSSATIQSLGSINQGLTSTEHNTMTFTYDDIAQLGAFSEWEDTQKTTIFSKWTKSSSISTITSSELRSLGHMTCAMTTSQIQQITTSVYEDSADKVGEVTSCSATQMVEFVNHAKTVYGSTVYNWTTVQITNVGVHIGGLSKTEIATLTDTQIDEILASHITLIPSSVFSGFTATQLRNLSPAQAQATTTTQRSTLSASQISALEAAAGVSYTSSSGVERSVQVSWLVLALTVVLKLSL
uniref:Otoancorin n=1 Tax=Magallana gigas TaxID=29159 RepID=K1RK31_MAGGI